MNEDRLTDEQMDAFERELQSEVAHLAPSLEMPENWRFSVHKASQWDHLNCIEIRLYFGEHRELQVDQAAQAALAFTDMAAMLSDLHDVRIYREERSSTYRVNGLFHEFSILVLVGKAWKQGSMNKAIETIAPAFREIVMNKADEDFESDRTFNLKMERDRIASAERTIAAWEAKLPPSKRNRP